MLKRRARDRFSDSGPETLHAAMTIPMLVAILEFGGGRGRYTARSKRARVRYLEFRSVAIHWSGLHRAVRRAHRIGIGSRTEYLAFVRVP
jgi:hypothetical protein